VRALTGRTEGGGSDALAFRFFKSTFTGSAAKREAANRAAAEIRIFMPLS